VKLNEFLALIVEALDEAAVPFMLTGSLAASYHGAPRATQDIDLVVDAEVEALIRLSATLQAAGLYVSDDAVREAAELRGKFNAVDPTSGWKADFIVRKDRAFSRSEFESRQPVQFAGLSLHIAQAEDLIVAKLEWSNLGDSERQLRDAAEVIQVHGTHSIDLAHIEHWVEALSLETQWANLRELVRRRGGAI